MANLGITGSINFNSLESDAKQVLLDFTYPIGSYFITENKAFNTIQKVHDHFGGTWERITSRMLYASSNDDVGTDNGSNTVTLSEANLPSHSHSFSGTTGSSTPENLTFSGVGVSGHVGGIRTEANKDLNCDGKYFTANNSHTLSDNNYWDSPDDDWQLKGFNWNYTPSGAVYGGAHTHSFSGDTGTKGSGTEFSIVSANRRVYMYHRIA